MKIVLAVSLCTSIAAASLGIRAQAAQVAFEVATIRPVRPGASAGVSVGQRVEGQQLRIGAYTLRDCLVMAYRVRPYQLVGPDWIGEDRFDVVAASTSAYNFSINVGEENYVPVLLRASANAGVPVAPQGRALIARSGNPLVEAIEQVGLKADSRRAPIEVIVVDGARRTPTD